MAGARPSGTVTFLFTDVVGSSRLWEERADEMSAELAEHDAVLRQAIESHGGYVFSTAGDSFAAAFSDATAAVEAAQAAQASLTLPVRMGLHAGTADERDGDYFGPAVNRAARVMAAGRGGQILLSAAAAALTTGVELVDLGEHQLRDLRTAEHLWQVGSFDHGSLHTLSEHPTNLRLASDSFHGREAELAEILQLVGQRRVVTLVGVGGVGKTRLALQAAGEALPSFEDGAWFAELAVVGDESGIEDAILRSVGAVRGESVSARHALLGWLGRRRLLLVIDNCEHLLDDVADVVEEVLATCAGVTVLATSREALAVNGETLIGVGVLETNDGVDLFTSRLTAVRRDAPLDAAAVRVLVERLDGIPLAIELAAARARGVSVAEVLERLEQRFELLGGRSRRRKRHQTLRATLDWSYDLLDEDERLALRRMAIFNAPFELSDAEAVISGEDVDRPQVLDLVLSLEDKSLLSPTEVDGVTRHRMLDTIREYSLERLAEAGETAAVRRRHAEHFAAVAAGLAARMSSPEQHAAVDELQRVVDDLRSAVAFACDTSNPDLAGRLVAPFVVSPFSTPASVVDLAPQVIELPGFDDCPTAVDALVQASWSCYLRMDFDAGLRLLNRASTLGGASDAGVLLLTATMKLGTDLEGAAQIAQEAHDAARGTDRPFHEGQALVVKALAHELLNDFESMAEPVARACELADRLQDPTLLCTAAMMQAQLLLQSDPEQAAPAAERARAVGMGVHPQGVANATGQLARIAAERGDLATALELYLECLEMLTEASVDLDRVMFIVWLARDLAKHGHLEAASRLCGSAYRQLPPWPYMDQMVDEVRVRCGELPDEQMPVDALTDLATRTIEAVLD